MHTSPVLWVDAPAGAFCFLQKHCLIFVSVYKSRVTGGRSRRGFCFLQKHRLIFLSVYKSCVMGGRSRRGVLFSSKTPSYIFECIRVLCYGWALPQGLFVFFKSTFLYFGVYTGPVLPVDAPAGAFCCLQKHIIICLSVYKSSGAFCFVQNTLCF